MKKLKLFFAAFALMLTASTFANSAYYFEVNRGSITYEIEKMLKDSGLIIDEEFTVTVIFEVNEEQKIEIYSVKSQNEEVNEFIEKRLNHRKLKGEGWSTEKFYELPVKVKSRR